MARSASAGTSPVLMGAARLALAFAPWFTFWGLVAFGRPGMAAPLGALVALLLLVRELRIGQVRPFSLFTVVFLALAALLGVLFGPTLSDKMTGLMGGGFFFLLAAFLYGLLQHEPFAQPYLSGSREEGAPDSYRAALRISWLWSAACFYSFIICLLGMTGSGQASLDTTVRLAVWPLPVVLLVSLALLAPLPPLPVPEWAWLRRLPNIGAALPGFARRAPKPSPGEASPDRDATPASPPRVIRTAAPLPEQPVQPEPPEPQEASESRGSRRDRLEKVEGKKPRRRKADAETAAAGALALPQASLPRGYTVAIVGGGLGGLVCGALLARAGADVVLAEQHDQVGGYFNSYRTGGFLFDVGPQMSLGIGSGPWAELNRTLGLDGRMDTRRMNAGVVIGEAALRIPENLEEFAAKLIKRFPADKKGFYRLLADLEAFELERAAARNGGVLPPENQRDLRRYVKQRPRAVEMAAVSFEAYLADFLKDAASRSAWGSLALMLGEQAASVSALAMAEAITCFFEEGGYCLAGGNGSYATALAEIIESQGGTILTGQAVREILLTRDGDSARGIILEDGSVVKSEAVVSDAGLVQTARHLIRSGALESSYLKWVDSFSPSPSSVVLYLALAGDLDLPGHIYLTPPESEYVRLPGGKLELSTVLLSVGSQADPSRARAGHHAVTMSAPVPPEAFDALVKGSDEASLAAQITGAAMQRMALTAIPDLYERLVFQELASPLTLHQLTRSFKGAAFGLRQSPGQELMARPGVRGPLDGLWLVGADTRYGVGARGAVMSALAAYREIAGGGSNGTTP